MPDRRRKRQETAPQAADGGRVSRVAAALRPARRAYIRAFARLPRPARLLWIFLAILGGYAIAFNLDGIGLASLVVLPVVAVLMDIMFQRFRFRSVRAPDAALASGMFLALLLPPTVPLLQAGAVTVAAMTLRHAVRYRGRPLLNPAAAGVVIGTLVFGMAPSWWGSIQASLVVVLGLVLTLRSPGSWRLPVGFIVPYAALSPLANLLFGEATSPRVLLIGALDPSMLFFALFIVSEPRTSSAKPASRLSFGLYVGTATVFLLEFLPSLAPFVALLLGNLMAVVTLRLETGGAARSKSAKRRSARRSWRNRQPLSWDAWGDLEMGQRIAAGFTAFALVGVIALASQGPSLTPSAEFRPAIVTHPTVGGAANDCTKDNPSVPADILTFLHGRLGPSVILSADPSSGTVVFYDPVNSATVTETDIYEDFGYAEFNGDDYVTMGCSS